MLAPRVTFVRLIAFEIHGCKLIAPNFGNFVKCHHILNATTALARYRYMLHIYLLGIGAIEAITSDDFDLLL